MLNSTAAIAKGGMKFEADRLTHSTMTYGASFHNGYATIDPPIRRPMHSEGIFDARVVFDWNACDVGSFETLQQAADAVEEFLIDEGVSTKAA